MWHQLPKMAQLMAELGFESESLWLYHSFQSQLFIQVKPFPWQVSFTQFISISLWRLTFYLSWDQERRHWELRHWQTQLGKADTKFAGNHVKISCKDATKRSIGATPVRTCLKISILLWKEKFRALEHLANRKRICLINFVHCTWSLGSFVRHSISLTYIVVFYHMDARYISCCQN